MTYPWAKQGHRPVCGFWSVSDQALKTRAARRSSTRSQRARVFILAAAIYSISAILFALLLFWVFVDDSLHIKQREIQSLPLNSSTMIPLSNTLCLAGTDASCENT